MSEHYGATGKALSRDDKGYKPFFSDQTPRRYSRDRVVDVAHIKLELTVVPTKKVLDGVATLTVIPIDEGVTSLTLDACDMDIPSVSANEEIVPFRYDGKQLRIDFPHPLAADQPVDLRIPYRVVNPRAGIYFIGPDEHYPNRPVEVWTQGQDEDSRYWFPCFDYPNEKATTEMIVTVPKPFNTLSNGKLLSVIEQGASQRFHWKHDVPHVAYLVTLVVGDFIEVRDQWDGIPVTYFHHPGDEAKASNSFAATPKMVQFFSERIGVRYPYAKYSQIPVTEFIFGGMENTTATTQTAYTLHDDRAHLDFSSHPLVSHELAHQWFGNLITCRDWSHGWLNEGFTTYMECCWEQHEHGDDHFRHYMLLQMEAYLDEDAESYRRPIVCNRYDEPIELFDRHLYEKGACVQHMIRYLLGEKLFWKALKHYTVSNTGRAVVTSDWLRAIEEATGRNLDEFFEQWVYGGGHPEFKLGFSYDAARKLATLTVRQTQKPDDLTSIFKLPVRVAFTQLGQLGSKNERIEQTIRVEQGEQQFHLPIAFVPDFFTFDVGNWILKTLDLADLPEEMLTRQLHHDTDEVARIHAARELGKRGTRRAVEALGKTLGTNAPWYVLAEVAKALGKVASPSALDQLLKHVRLPHPKARIGVVRALGEFRGEKAAADHLLSVLSNGDASYFVEAAAAKSLGKSRDSRAKDALYFAIDTKESFNEIIRIEAIEGLVMLEDTSALEKIRECCRRGVPVRLRYNALTKLGTLAKLADQQERQRVRGYLEETLLESDFFISLGTIAGLVALGDPQSSGALRRKSETAVDGRIRARARKGAETLAAKAEPSQQTKDLRDQLHELKKENKSLLERLEKLEAATQAAKN
ncbi:MAG: M1 family aminopeptidase [Planctomycetota bacterium]